MAEQYLINDTTLTSIADAIRETGWITNISDDEYSQAKLMLYSFSYNSTSYSCLENFLPDTLYEDTGYINQMGMPRAIQGILGVPDLARFVAREPLSGVVTLGEGITKIRSYAFATSDFELGLNNSVYKDISAFAMHNVTYIGDSAFENWSALSALYMFGNVVPSLGTGWERDFRSQFSGTVYVPASMYDDYVNNSQWNPTYHPPTIRSFYTASELGVRFLYGQSYGNFNSRNYSDATYGDQYLIDGSVLTAIASAIRGQLGVSTQYLPREMPSAIRQIGANDADLISTIEGTVQSYSDGQSSVYAVSDYAFAYCVDLSSVVLPACSLIGFAAFSSCSTLRYVSAPQVTSIYSYAFYWCSSLSNASFSRCTYLGSNAFRMCTTLTNASFSECSVIGSRTFESCNNLQQASFPKCQTIGSSAFAFCYVLSTISLPSCVDIASYAFNRCSSLMSIYLLGNSVVRLLSSTVFSLSPIVSSGFTGSFGSIYVPASLYNSYYNASVWSNYFRSRLVSM